ncbi:MAG: helix-turn-helix domain-containing protein [Hyphomicrobiaceae bacterium]
MSTPRDFRAPVLPTEAMVENAEDLIRHFEQTQGKLVVKDADDGHTIDVEPELFELIRWVLINLAQNRPMMITPLDHELTTVQAAAFLNVSRPHVIKLIERGELACHMVGTHRRIRLDELIKFKRASEEASERALQDLADISQEHDMGY